MSKIKKLILGTVQFGLDYGINNLKGKPSATEVERILINAYDSGIRSLDTAEVYGDAHEIIGNFHKNYPERKFDIITKIPQNFAGSLKHRFAKYMADLKVCKLEGVLFHSYDTYERLKGESQDLTLCKQEGTINTIGVSVYTNSQIENVISDKLIDIIQLPFNLLDNVNLRERVLQKAKDRGKIIHTRSAYLQGLFFIEPKNANNIYRLFEKEITLLRRIANNSAITMQMMALNYCLQQPLIDKVIIGVDNVAQLEQNIADVEFNLQESTINEINSISAVHADMLNPSLWN